MYKIDTLNINNHQKIILQFPSNQLKQSQQIWQQLTQQYPLKQFIISADPLYSSCCVNIIGASHINYDLIIHFGDACFSETQSNNIIYVFQYTPYDENKLLNIIEQINEECWLLFDQQYDHLNNINTKHIKLNHNAKHNHIACGYYAEQIRNNLIFIGTEESELFQKFILHFEYGKIQKCYIINPITCELKLLPINFMSLLLKRSKQVEETQNCNCFGILINNSTAKYTQNTYKLCKSILKQNNKKYYTFSMNNLNESKLGNFPEIDVYIIISCYRTSIIDTKQFYKLIITPFQLIQSFTNFDYVVKSDLNLFQYQQEQFIEQIEQNNKQEERQLILSQNQIVPLNQIFQTLDHFQTRNYQGLQIKDNLEPAILQIGLNGIASQYENEGQQK